VSNLLLFSGSGKARVEARKFMARVQADGGIVVSPDYIESLYSFCYKTFTSFPRRLYSARAGVKLNNVLGVNYVQTMYDLNNDSPIDLLQTTAANQPAWAVEGVSGYLMPSYNGTTAKMSLGDLGIYKNQGTGTIVSVFKDVVPTGGAASHVVINVRPNTDVGSRLGIISRVSGDVANIQGRRIDGASTIVVNLGAITTAFQYANARGDWTNGQIRGGLNGSNLNTAIGSSGNTSDTDSAFIIIGNNNAETAGLSGFIPELLLSRMLYTTDQLTALNNFYKRFYPSLP
jgi:hypothetical protein